METENDLVAVNGGSMTASAGSESVRSDGLLSQDQQEMCERVAHLEKRVREQEDEIVCLKGALADVLRRLGQVESVRSQNSLLPSKPFVKTARKTPLGSERPKSSYYEPPSPRPSSARQKPRGSSATSMNKKWSSMEKNIEGTNGHSSPRHNSSQLSHNNGPKEPTYDPEDKYLRMHLKGRPVCLYAPSDIDEGYNVRTPQEPPDAQLKLEWVYGYRGKDARNNLFCVNNEVIYFSGEVVVLHNFETNEQRHYLGHTDDVKCLAIHPDQTTAASGQVAGHEKKQGKHSQKAEPSTHPHVRIWDLVSLKTLQVIGEGMFARGVCCVNFSKMDGGKHLLAVDEGNDHTLYIFETKRGKKVCDTRSSESTVLQCEWHPYIDNQIVQCGLNQVTFWTYDGNSLNKKAGIFESYSKDKGKMIICIAFSDAGDVVTGDSNGNIHVWGKGTNKIKHCIPKIHEGGVFSLCVTSDGNMLSGGKDRKVIQWDSEYEKMDEKEIPVRYGPVRMISRGQGNMLLIGTTRNCILQGNFEMDFSAMVEGHKEEFWGLCARPGLQQFITCGTDKHIYCWDSQLHACVWMIEVAYTAHCISIHKDGEVAAIGCASGKWFSLDLDSHTIIGVYEDAKEQVECISFSPDGTMLAAGSRDNYIYVYNYNADERKFKKIGKCSGHSSFITHIDWSDNSEIIRSNCGAHECLHWTAKRCKQEANKEDFRDLTFATQNCTLSWNSIGIWQDNYDGTDINACAKSNDGTLISSADDFGRVNLFEYPSIQPRATGHDYGGHSSHVTNVCFLQDDTHVISAGGRDMTVLQFQVIRGQSGQHKL